MIHLGAFLGVVALISATPGPDTALVVRNAVARGRRGGLLTALGSASGLLVWGAAFSFGIGALLASSATAFSIVKLGGALLLVLLGGTLLLRPGRERLGAAPARLPAGSPFRQGLATNFLNPKAAAFFSALVPQFLANHAPFGAPLALAAIASAGSLAGLTLYAVTAAALRVRLERPSLRRLLDRATGCVLVALGMRVAFERR